MAKVEIKSVAGAVLYTADIDDSIPGGLQLRVALEKAASDRTNLRGANLYDANLRDANLRGANLYGANLRGADLYDANLYDANLRDANLRGANLYDANLRGADLYDANLRGANLCYANLRGANLYDADLRDADLCGADLCGANLCYANLYDADLRDADLRRADLRDADLRGAKLADDLTLVGERPVFTLGPIGSRSDTFVGYITNQGLRVCAGCFFGTPEEFTSALEAEHGTNAFGREYLCALGLLKLHAALYKGE